VGDVLSVLENIFLFGTFPANSGSGLYLMVLPVNGSWLMFSMWAVVLQHPIRSTGRICIYGRWKNFPLIDQFTQETEELTKVLALTHLMACVLSRDSQHSHLLLSAGKYLSFSKKYYVVRWAFCASRNLCGYLGETDR
jgi:hypothetical protein